MPDSRNLLQRVEGIPMIEADPGDPGNRPAVCKLLLLEWMVQLPGAAKFLEPLSSHHAHLGTNREQG